MSGSRPPDRASRRDRSEAEGLDADLEPAATTHSGADSRFLQGFAPHRSPTVIHIHAGRATFTGYREYPKYGMVSRYLAYKQALLDEAERLVQGAYRRDGLPPGALRAGWGELR